MINKTINKEKNKIKNNFVVFSFKNNQFKVCEGDKIHIPYVKELKENEKIKFDKVLLTNKKIGLPTVDGVTVEAKCLSTLHKGKKIIAFRYKSKKNVRVKKGHREKMTYIEITKINF